MDKLDKIIKETQEWLKVNGYNPTVGKIHLEAQELQNKRLATQLLREMREAHFI